MMDMTPTTPPIIALILARKSRICFPRMRLSSSIIQNIGSLRVCQAKNAVAMPLPGPASKLPTFALKPYQEAVLAGLQSEFGKKTHEDSRYRVDLPLDVILYPLEFWFSLRSLGKPENGRRASLTTPDVKSCGKSQRTQARPLLMRLGGDFL